jgi:hypothetical protein
MSNPTTISYRLPRAELVVSGTVRRTRDTILGGPPLAQQPAALVSHIFALRHVAGPGSYDVTLPRGWLRAFKGSFSYTPDRRLTAASAESTGQVGTILTAAATITGAVVAAGVALDDQSADDPVKKRYGDENQQVQNRHEQIVQLLDRVGQAELEVTDRALTDPADTPMLAARWDLLQRVRQSLESELSVLGAHFDAWHAGLTETVDEVFEFAVPLTALETSVGPLGSACSQESPKVPENLGELWTRYGVGVTAAWATGRGSQNVPVEPSSSQIATRVPDLVTLSVIEHRHGEAVVTASERHLVVDDYSQVKCFTLDKSRFGRRSLALTFDDQGMLTGVAVEGSASLADAASAAGQLPGAFSSGVSSLNTAVSGLATARRAAQDAQLAQVKQQVDLEQQKITQAGLLATAADAARLQRLQQLQAILTTQTAISQADPRLVSLLGTGTGPDLDWYQAPANGGAPAR